MKKRIRSTDCYETNNPRQMYRRQTADITEAGYKYHMNGVAAAIGRGNLRSVQKVIAHRGIRKQISHDTMIWISKLLVLGTFLDGYIWFRIQQ